MAARAPTLVISNTTLPLNVLVVCSVMCLKTSASERFLVRQAMATATNKCVLQNSMDD